MKISLAAVVISAGILFGGNAFAEAPAGAIAQCKDGTYYTGTSHKGACKGHEGVKEAMVVPISFVTEHIETLHEINIDGRLDAKKAGIERYRMMPAVGDSPLFIGALKDLVLRAVEVRADQSTRSSVA